MNGCAATGGRCNAFGAGKPRYFKAFPAPFVRCRMFSPEPLTLYGADFTVSLKVPVEGGKIYYNFEGQPARETDYLYEKPFPSIKSSADRTILLVLSACEQIGVITIICAVGSTIGPPADRL